MPQDNTREALAELAREALNYAESLGHPLCSPICRREAYEAKAALFEAIAALSSQPPAPSWQTIEVLPVRGREVILVALAWRKFGEHEDGTPCETSGAMVTEGEYIPRHGDMGGYFMAFASPVGDSEGVTHWMPLHSAPSTEGAAG